MLTHFFFLLLCVLTVSLHAISTDELIAQAHQHKLSETHYWHLLMHAPNDESEIDDSAFFLSTDGKTDLFAELDATIRYFNEESNRSDESAFCRFPARRAWLEKELGTSFGEGSCQEYETLLAKMDPQKVTLVFPSAHINSPASMFGHTFLRIDSSMESKLMSYAINYAAQTDETNGFAFAYKGLFGGYRGFYSMLPYYEKLKEYRDSESRDVWEYDLNLTPEEVLAMVRHIWELQRINSWYFFLDENCSYHMLWLSEIARPTVKLREHFWYYVIPPDTVRAFEEEGLVENKHFRPSKRTKLLAYEDRLSPEGIRAVKLLSTDVEKSKNLNADNFSEQELQWIYEAAAELAEYDYIEGKLSKERYIAHYHSLLSARAKLGAGKALTIPTKSNPDTSHRSARFSMAQGWFHERSPLLLGIRPAFHDLDEEDSGRLMGAQIEFLDTQIGIDRDRAVLEKLTVLSLASLAPVSHFFKPFSWRMKAGWDRDYGGDRLSFVTRIGAGAAIGNEDVYGYFLSEPEVRIQTDADIGVGFSGGLAFNWGIQMKTHLEVGHIFYLENEDTTRIGISHLWQYDPSGAIYARYETVEQEYQERRGIVGINLYF